MVADRAAMSPVDGPHSSASYRTPASPGLGQVPALEMHYSAGYELQLQHMSDPAHIPVAGLSLTLELLAALADFPDTRDIDSHPLAHFMSQIHAVCRPDFARQHSSNWGTQTSI